MEANGNYFPWHSFQLWLREGLFMGSLLNKLKIASQDKNKTQPYPPKSHQEEIDLLNEVLKWISSPKGEKYGGSIAVIKQLIALGPNKEYPKLKNEEARTLWQALSEYGTSTARYEKLDEKLGRYLTSFDGDAAMVRKKWMNGLWRSIGPAMDPDRKAIVEAAAKEEAKGS